MRKLKSKMSERLKAFDSFNFFFVCLFGSITLIQSCDSNNNAANFRKPLSDSLESLVLRVYFSNESDFDRSASVEIEIDSAMVLNGNTSHLFREIVLSSGKHRIHVNIKNKNIERDTTLDLDCDFPLSSLFIKYFYRPAYSEEKELYRTLFYEQMIKGKALHEKEKQDIWDRLKKELERDVIEHPERYSKQQARIEIQFDCTPKLKL